MRRRTRAGRPSSGSTATAASSSASSPAGAPGRPWVSTSRSVPSAGVGASVRRRPDCAGPSRRAKSRPGPIVTPRWCAPPRWGVGRHPSACGPGCDRSGGAIGTRTIPTWPPRSWPRPASPWTRWPPAGSTRSPAARCSPPTSCTPSRPACVGLEAVTLRDVSKGQQGVARYRIAGPISAPRGLGHAKAFRREHAIEPGARQGGRSLTVHDRPVLPRRSGPAAADDRPRRRRAGRDRRPGRGRRRRGAARRALRVDRLRPRHPARGPVGRVDRGLVRRRRRRRP